MEGPVAVGQAEATDEVILEYLDGLLGCIDAVICWFKKLPFAVLLLEEGFDRLHTLIVCHVECWLVSFIFEFVEDGLKGGDDLIIIKVVGRLSKDIVCVVVVCNKEVLHAI